MFKCIESPALMDMCRALGLFCNWHHEVNNEPEDIYIVEPGAAEQFEFTRNCYGFKLSDYLLATAPVDVKEA